MTARVDSCAALEECPKARGRSLQTHSVMRTSVKSDHARVELAALQQSDPEKFKQVVGQIADQLSQAASSQTGAAANKLSELADKFKTAAESGDLSALQPPAHPGHGGGHHAHTAYAKHAPPDAGGDAVKSAMDSAFDLIDQATSSSSTASAQPV